MSQISVVIVVLLIVFLLILAVLILLLKGDQAQRYRNRLMFPLPFPACNPSQWESYHDLIVQLGFKLYEAFDQSPYGAWPSPIKVYVHTVFNAFAELGLYPTGKFRIQFTTLFPEGSVRTVAGEKLITLHILSINDWMNWKAGSLVSVWEEHMNSVAKYEGDHQSSPMAASLEAYYDFLSLFKTSLYTAIQEERLFPETVHDYLTSGFANLELGRKKKVFEMFRKAAMLDSGNFQIYRMTGKIALVVHDFKGAADFFAASLKLKPDDKQSYFLLADTWLLLNKKRQSFEALKKAKEVFPSDQEILLRLGKIATDLGELGDASLCLEEINTVESASVELFQALGRLYEKKRDRQKSQEYYRLARVFAREKGERSKLPWQM